MISQKEVSQIVRERLDDLYKSAKTLEIKEAQQKIVNFYSNLRDFPDCEERMGTAEFERHREYFLAKLIEIKNAPLTSDKGKIRHDLENNGLPLPDLIKLYKEINNEINNDKNPFSHLKKLKECQSASPDTNLGKATTTLNNNGDFIK